MLRGFSETAPGGRTRTCCSWVPWWEFTLRATVVYLVLLAMVRLTGKRTVGQFTPFDMLVVMQM